MASLAWALPLVCQAQGTKKSGEESLLLSDIPSVFGASRFDQLVTEAPASVSVITAEDIATYGWRTLADVLRTVRGFYVTNDRSYSYVGTRGFSRPGDFNSRILVLLDGVRVNENIFDGGYIGMASLVDLSTVERVEVIRGPSSSLYGTNALLGIVSVVTARGRARGGVRVMGELGNFGTKALSMIAGHRTAAGIEFLGEATSRRVDGQDHYFREFDSPSTSNGVAKGRDGERRDRVLLKAEKGSFAAEGTLNLHEKQIPTGAFETSFNQGRHVYQDNLANLTLRYQPTEGPRSGLRGSLSLSRYDYDGEYPYTTTTSSEWARGRWAVGDLQYNRKIGRNRVVIGGAYTNNWRQEQGVIEEVGMPPVFVDTTTSAVAAIYALTESRVGQHVIFNGGLRFDHVTGLRGSWNPRAALIYTLSRGSAVKLPCPQQLRALLQQQRSHAESQRGVGTGTRHHDRSAN
jgi:outer membrane receptor for ferrienterochelin and colicin